MSGSETFFRYAALNDEIAAKIASLSRPAAEQADELLAELQRRGMCANDVDRTRELLSALESCPFDLIYPNYLSHPIRVTAAYCREDGTLCSYRGAALALCHNFRETALSGQDSIEGEFLDDEIRTALDIFFTDRTQEHDPAYLTRFYDRINAAPHRLMELKGHDKLDNFLSYVLYDIDRYHFEVVENLVLPRLLPINRRLANYLSSVVRAVSTPALKSVFRY
jgi:hypothetical protein